MLDKSFIERYHIPVLQGQDWNSAVFSNGYQTAVFEVQQDIQDAIERSDNGSLGALHGLIWGEWLLDNGTPNKCYHAPYSPVHIVNGEGVILFDQEGSYEWLRYLGKWKYLFPGELPVLLTAAQIEACFSSYGRAVVSNPDVKYPKEFVDFYYNLLGSWMLQFENKSGNEEYPFKATQRVNGSFVNELNLIHKWFWPNEAVEVIENLNERKIIENGNDLDLHQNRNSRSFFRDGNYSLSFVDVNSPDAKEVAMISFAPTNDKALEVVQIAWSKDYRDADFLWLWTQLVERLKLFAKEEWFDSIRVLRWDKNANFVFPRQNALNDGFNLKAHQETMMLRYSVTPQREWWFDKPGERYSEFKL